jgi:beta-xylosidase
MRINRNGLHHATLLLIFVSATYAQPIQTAKNGPGNQAASVLTTENGDGTYQNPIIHADYSDPDVIRVGDDFYLTASSFNCVPGLPILQSKDLVNWAIIGHALNRLSPEDAFSKPQHGNGVWAPAIRFHQGELYIYFGDPDHGIFMTKTKGFGQHGSPLPGPPPEYRERELTWEPLHHVLPARGPIDTCPFWDDDGSAYLINAFSRMRAGFRNVLRTAREMNRDNADKG